MSLGHFLKRTDVTERLKPFRPTTRKISVPLLVPPGTGSPTLAGAAFDYLLRFELQRRAPHAVGRTWVAELVPDYLCRSRTESGVTTMVGRDLLEGKHPYLSPREASQRTRMVCEGARRTLTEYLRQREPRPDTRETLAAWAVKLAKVEAAFRADVLDPAFEEAPAELVEDLLRLIAVVPFDQLIDPTVMLLNPNFGTASESVGGADADLISGRTLVDFKTTKNAELKAEHLDQLFGYFLLARRSKTAEVSRAGVYFSRHGHLWTHDTTQWTTHPGFGETEQWFFDKAQEVYGR